MGDSRAIGVIAGRFDPLVGFGLASVLSRHPDVALEGMGVANATIEFALSRGPALVALLDGARVSAPASLPLLVRLRRRAPSSGLVVLTDHPTGAQATSLLQHGASACVGKDSPPSDLLDTIRDAAQGGRAARPAVDFARGMELLTEREIDVLELVSLGHSNPQIARRLHVGVETVRTHVAHIFQKLGVRSRNELVGVQPPRGAADQIIQGRLEERNAPRVITGPRVRLTIGARSCSGAYAMTATA